MFPYWLLFIVLGAGAILYATRVPTQGSALTAARTIVAPDPFLPLAAILVMVMTGLRYRVGGDWDAYLRIFRSIGSKDLERAFQSSGLEPGYTLVNWIVGQAGLEIWAVNLLCALPFVAGLIGLSRKQPNPWLALVVATPVFIVGVGMGYTRQATAAGFLLIGLVKLLEGRSFHIFMIWALLGALFHQSVLVLVPLVALFLFESRLGSILLIIAALLIGYLLLLPMILDSYASGYIRSVYQAEGAIFRIGLNAIAAVLVLAFPNRYHTSALEMRIWRGWAVLAIASLAAFFFVSSSVILDRLAVYLLPLQIYAFSRLPTAFGQRVYSNLGLTAVVISYSTVVLFVWLNFANNAINWVPYRLYPLS